MIAKLDIFAYACPWPGAKPAGATATREGFLLRAVDREGVEGWGEAAAWSTGDSAARLRQALSTVGLDDANALLDDSKSAPGGRSCTSSEACCGLETAVLDLKAKRRGLSVAATLGLSRRSRVNNSCLVWDEAQAVALARRGVRQFKLKAPAGQEAWLAIYDAIDDASEGQARFRIDGAATWSRDDARDVLSHLNLERVLWIEQPMPVERLDDTRWLRETWGVRVSLDETLRHAIVSESASALTAFAGLQAAGCLDVVTLKPMFVGGWFQALRLAQAAKSLGVGVCITHAMDTEVGRAACRELAAIVAEDDVPCGIETTGLAGFGDIDRIGDNDTVAAPERPGFGVTPPGDNVLQHWRSLS